MAAEAFDPFANDDDDEFLHDVTHPSPPIIAPPSPIVASPRDAPRSSPRRSPRSSARRKAPINDASQSSDSSYSSNRPNYVRKNIRVDDVMKEFDTAFPSMTLNDNDSATDQFGFPSTCFPATFEPTSGVDGTNTNSTTPFQSNPVISNLEGVTFVIAEEMSVIHNSQTNQCSVKVRGNISLQLEAHSHANPGQQMYCDVSLLDPNGHLDTAASKNYDYAQPIASANEFTTMNHSHAAVSDTAFRISMPEFNGQKDNWSGSPLIEYTCGDTLRPVPMLINTYIQEFNDQCQIMFQLRVNPRNINSLLDTVVLVSVPDEFDGEKAQVSSVGRTIGKGNIDTNWSGITRILSWKLGELYSGAICEFEALFPPSDLEPVQEIHGVTDTKFPVLLRYDSEGSLLSDVDINFGDGLCPPSIRRNFRVYHREI